MQLYLVKGAHRQSAPTSRSGSTHKRHDETCVPEAACGNGIGTYSNLHRMIVAPSDIFSGEMYHCYDQYIIWYLGSKTVEKTPKASVVSCLLIV
jgi:hypothetical protein